MYNQSKNAIPIEEENAPNLRYVWLVKQLMLPYANTHAHTCKAYREAAQVILAKYFEVCDIYEHPDKVNSA